MDCKVKNIAVCSGVITRAPEKINVFGRTDLYRLHVNVVRQSGIEDRIIVIFRENSVDVENLEGCAPMLKLHIGANIVVTGKLQAMRNMAAMQNDIFIYADYIRVGYAAPQNDLYFVGALENDPRVRRTPRGKDLTDVIVLLRSEFGENFRCKVPVLFWNHQVADAAGLKAGDVIAVAGRLQSRIYTKKHESSADETHEINEVSVQSFKKTSFSQESLEAEIDSEMFLEMAAACFED